MKKAISSLLGALKYNEEEDCFYGNYADEKHEFSVSLFVSEEELSDLLSEVEARLTQKFFEPLLSEMEEEMLEIKNESWLEEGESSMPMSVFRKAISIENIGFYEDGTGELICNAEDVFWGHSIMVGFDEHGGYEGADLVS